MSSVRFASTVALSRRYAGAERTERAAIDRRLVVLVVVVATGAALWMRLTGLTSWDGTLSVDEARLAMAGRGILEHGLPVLPSGWTYTRGLLAAYLVAPSLAILGPTDLAARLPSALAGAALVPVAYLLGARVAGRWGGVFAALFVMGHPSLVIWSRQAWLYALYVLLFTASLLFVVRAHQTGRTADQLVAGGLLGLTLFVHELGIFLLAPLGAQVGARLWRDRRASERWVGPLLSVGVVALAAGLFWVLVSGLRASSLVGAYGEIDEYFEPRLADSNMGFYLRMLLDGPGLLLLAALAGVPLALMERRLTTGLLWLALVPPFVHAAFVIPRGPQERYGLTLVVVLAVLAGESIVAWARRLEPRVARTVLGRALVPVLLGLALLAHQDVARALERGALNPREGAWLRETRGLGIGPDDLVMSDVPTIAGWYVGGLDFWVSSRDYEKYTTRDGDVLRDVHTGAALVRSRRDFDRLVARPHAGQTLWVIASRRSYQWNELVDDDLKQFLQRSANLERNPGDNTRIWRMELGSPP